MKKFICRGWLKTWEEDRWKEGQIPKTGGRYSDKLYLEAPTLKELAEAAAEALCLDTKYVGLYRDDCRFDIERFENDEAEEFPESKKKEWKAGKVKGWAAIYSFKFEVVEVLELKDEDIPKEFEILD